jgi:uncharacterized membrane protein
MAPLIVLIAGCVAFWFAGWLGVTIFQHANTVLRSALGLMFFLTASAHWGKRRCDLIRMVPPIFPRPDLLVTITGVLEILGALGLFIPGTARGAGICLALLLIALFLANIHAAHEKLTIAGQPVPGLPVRTGIQIVFVASLASAAFLT